MTVRLTVSRDAWLAHVDGTAAAYGHGLVAVVKGNGYGFGRTALHEVVRAVGATFVAVGTVHEVDDVPAALTPVVLTPTLRAPSSTRPILTVGSVAHVEALAGWGGRVMVKLQSSMRRFGARPDELAAVEGAARAAGLVVEAYSIHLPLAGDDEARTAEIEAWLSALQPGVAVWTSHLGPGAYHALRAAHPDRVWSVRVGTGLWHGVPRGTFVRLTADALHTHLVRAGDVAGYRHTVVPFDGTLVVVGAGTAAGVVPLDHTDPTLRSPFHFARNRLHLLEPPHMHSSLVLVPHGTASPSVGDRVDVQRPLTTTLVDEVEWR